MRVLNESMEGDRGKTRERGGVGMGFGIQSKGSDQARHSSSIVPSRWYCPCSVLDNFFFCTTTVQHYPTSLAPSDSNSTFHIAMIVRHGIFLISHPRVKRQFYFYFLKTLCKRFIIKKFLQYKKEAAQTLAMSGDIAPGKNKRSCVKR